MQCPIIVQDCNGRQTDGVHGGGTSCVFVAARSSSLSLGMVGGLLCAALCLHLAVASNSKPWGESRREQSYHSSLLCSLYQVVLESLYCTLGSGTVVVRTRRGRWKGKKVRFCCAMSKDSPRQGRWPSNCRRCRSTAECLFHCIICVIFHRFWLLALSVELINSRLGHSSGDWHVLNSYFLIFSLTFASFCALLLEIPEDTIIIQHYASRTKCGR